MKKTIKELSKEDAKVIDLFTTAVEHCDAQVRRLNKEGDKEGATEWWIRRRTCEKLFNEVKTIFNVKQ